MDLILEELTRTDKFNQGIPQIKMVEAGTWREKLAVALCHLSIEHHHGVITLSQDRHYSPALALFRPQMEAWLRSMWVDQMATDGELNAFMDGEEFVMVPSSKNDGTLKKKRIPPPIRDIILSIKDEGERQALLDNYDSTWSVLCDFTHGGALQIKARLQSDGMRTIYPERNIAGLIHASTRLQYLAMMEMAELLNDADLGRYIHDLFNSIYYPSDKVK